MAESPLIELQDITKIYRMGDNELRALNGVNLKIHAGECVAVMGSSGSGKSTLMNVLGCLDRPTSGRYLLNGRDVSQLTSDKLAEIRNRTLGFVFQSFNLLARTSALENVELPLLYAGVAARERRARAEAALQQVGLGARVHHHPNQMSGGQQQRVAIARAIVGKPALILADEPTGNLDTRTSAEIMALFQEFGKRGITIVVVTHEEDIAQYTERVLTMRDGALVRDQTRTAVPAQKPAVAS